MKHVYEVHFCPATKNVYNPDVMSDEWMEKAICRDRLAPQNIFVVQNNKKVFVILPQRLEIFYLDNLFELEPLGNKSNQCVFYLL